MSRNFKTMVTCRILLIVFSIILLVTNIIMGKYPLAIMWTMVILMNLYPTIKYDIPEIREYIMIRQKGGSDIDN